MLLVETLKSGDIICLVRDIQGKGIMPHHFKDMTNGQFTTHYGINKEDWFEQQHIPANVFIRTTTKKDGRTRSLIAPHRGRNSQLAVFDDEILQQVVMSLQPCPKDGVQFMSHPLIFQKVVVNLNQSDIMIVILHGHQN